MRAFLGITLAGALVGCRAPTQISVQVSTNVACTSWQGAAVAVGELGPSLETKPAATTTTYCDDAGYIGTVVAIPSGAESANVAFRVVGAVSQTLEQCTIDASTGCIVARRALNFIPHTALSLSVPLVSSCEGILCDPSTTCVEGTCRPATIPDPGQCADQTCGEGALASSDGGGVLDATVGDGGGQDGGTPDAAPADAQSTDGASRDGAAGLDAGIAACGARCAALSLGASFTCALRSGEVSCWGENYLGELGRGTESTLETPNFVLVGTTAPLSGVQGIVSGYDTSCAFVGGGLSCWGGGAPLMLSDEVNDRYATPQPLFAGASAMSMANYHLCWQHGAEISCATVGTREEGSFGDVVDAGPDSGFAVTLVLPDASPGPFPQLDSSAYFTCVLDGVGNIYCLGDNDDNECDPSSANPSGVLTTFVHAALPGGAVVQEISLMEQTACARSQGQVYCWGTDYNDARGGLPDGGSATFNPIVYADGGPVTGAIGLASGEYHTCALLGTTEVACWGDNQFHELGRGEPVGQPGTGSTVAQIVQLADGGAFAGITFVAAGGYHTCATTSDGTLWCWGDNGSGQTAPGDTTARSSPSVVAY